ncbi:MAG TPA: hypothetical protein VFP68_03670 [Burkholderiaceae bacterium]|nr:hypothetical protein [Burkholderiaceae bacterium]
MPSTDTAGQPEELLAIYRKLKKGVGHELVTDENVFALIDIAARDGNKHIEALLREWQSPCSDGSEGVPSTIAPTKGFNRENVKH